MTGRPAAMAFIAVLILMPVTLPVPVLRELVQERFAVSQLLTSLFMSINMIGAVLTAPLAGALADRIGRRRELIVAALLVDAAVFWGMTAPVGFGWFLGMRFVEGCAHIFALSLLLSVASGSAPAERRGRIMGLVGGGIMLGVALGAPLGGLLGRGGPLVPLRAGAGLALLAAVVCALALPRVDRGGESSSGARAIVRALRENGALAAPLAFAFADRFTVGFFTTTFSLYLSSLHGLAAPQIGLLISLFMLPFAGLSYPFGRLSERVSRAGLLCVGSVVYGLGTASLGWWPVELLWLLMAGLGVAAAVMFVPSLIVTTDLAPPEIRSTALGAFNAAGSLGFIVGPLVGGLVSQSVAAGAGWEAGYRAAFVVAGGSEMLCVLATLPLLLRLIRQGRTT